MARGDYLPLRDGGDRRRSRASRHRGCLRTRGSTARGEGSPARLDDPSKRRFDLRVGGAPGKFDGAIHGVVIDAKAVHRWPGVQRYAAVDSSGPVAEDQVAAHLSTTRKRGGKDELTRMPRPPDATDQDRAPPIGALQESVGQWSGSSAWQREPERRHIRRPVDQYMNEIRRRRRQLRGRRHHPGLRSGNRTPVGQKAPLGKTAPLASQRNPVHGRPTAAASNDVRASCPRAGDRHRSRARGTQQPALHTRGPSRT